jgi:hypothetical protein
LEGSGYGLIVKVLSQHLPGAPEECMYTQLTVEKKIRILVCEVCLALVTRCLLMPLRVGASLALRNDRK